MDTPSPFVSIIIVTWNSARLLPRCLDSLAQQSFRDFEVVIVDNGSSDGALEKLSETYPTLNLSLEKLGENRGFAVGNNTGAALARGRWLALLNTDAFPEPDWLAQLVQAAQTHPEFNSFASRQLQEGNPTLLDGIGDAYHISGLAWREGYNLPAAQMGLTPREVFSPCAAAALYLRDDFLHIGGFDTDYFSYFEDVDLGFRLRLLGGRCLYVPTAVVHHIGSASTGKSGDFSVYYGHRNLVWTYVKNMPLLLLLLFLPLHLAMSLLLFMTKSQKSVFLKSKLDALCGLPAILQKRHQVQQQRRVSSREIVRTMNHDLLGPLPAFRARRKIE